MKQIKKKTPNFEQIIHLRGLYKCPVGWTRWALVGKYRYKNITGKNTN